MKIFIKCALFFILVIDGLSSCERQNENSSISGVWIQEGYGRILLIKDSIYTYYNTTANSCMPLIADGVLTDRFRIVDSRDDKLILNPGGIVDYHFRRWDKLPENCNKEITDLNHSPQTNFNVLWNTFDEHYAFFKQRNINWDKIKKQSQATLNDIKTDKELYDFFAEILKSFNDGHINLKVPDSLITSSDPKKNSVKKRLKNDVLADISNMYIKSIKSYNNGVVQWGILKSKNIGYILITDMNDFSNYVPNKGLSSNQFRKAYEKVLRTKSGIGLLDDELKGVHFVMDMVLDDLSETESVIIDLRFNGGGYETVALGLLSHFVNEPKHILSISAKNGNGYTEEQKYILRPAKNSYQGKVSLLTSRTTASAAEIFVLGTMAYPEIKRFGSTTNGIFSEILWKNLPNGWEFSLSNEIYSDPNGTIFEIIGVPVHFEINYPDNRTDFYNSFYIGNGFRDIGLERILTSE